MEKNWRKMEKNWRKMEKNWGKMEKNGEIIGKKLKKMEKKWDFSTKSGGVEVEKPTSWSEKSTYKNTTKRKHRYDLKKTETFRNDHPAMLLSTI